MNLSFVESFFLIILGLVCLLRYEFRKAFVRVKNYAYPDPADLPSFLTSEVCYGDLGCFSTEGTFAHTGYLPDSPSSIGTRFWLYTKENPDDADEIMYNAPASLAASRFDPKRPTKVIVHEFGGNGNSSWVRKVRDRFLLQSDVNVLTVDYRDGAAYPDGWQCTANTEVVARQLAILLQHMMKLGNEPGTMHLVGFSLGSQVVGLTGSRTQFLGFKVGMITGLDPPHTVHYEHLKGHAHHLDASDADFVEIIHTNGESMYTCGLGTTVATGHADYFPNGGVYQPGCSHVAVETILYPFMEENAEIQCHHRRAVHFFMESLLPGCEFKGFSCPTLRDFKTDFLKGPDCFSCSNGACESIGHKPEHVGNSRSLYLVTHGSVPLCGFQMKVQLTVSLAKTPAYGTLEIELSDGSKKRSILVTDSSEEITPGTLYRVGATEYPPIHLKAPIKARVSFEPYNSWLTKSATKVRFSQLSITDEEGNRVSYCGPEVTIDAGTEERGEATIILQEKSC